MEEFLTIFKLMDLWSLLLLVWIDGWQLNRSDELVSPYLSVMVWYKMFCSNTSSRYPPSSFCCASMAVCGGVLQTRSPAFLLKLASVVISFEKKKIKNLILASGNCLHISKPGQAGEGSAETTIAAGLVPLLSRKNRNVLLCPGINICRLAGCVDSRCLMFFCAARLKAVKGRVLTYQIFFFHWIGVSQCFCYCLL